jgi:hypothetical protein
VEVEALVSKIEAGSWPERVAAVRSVPNEFPGREVAGVYAEVARSVYVPNLAPSFLVHRRKSSQASPSPPMSRR